VAVRDRGSYRPGRLTGVGKQFATLEPKLVDWIDRQRLFFVGTAPSDDGHVNVSPKGPIGSLRVLGDTTIAYLDWVGSGVETIAHLRENGRIVVMLCAFEGPPRIVRLHGRGTVHEAGTARFAELAPAFGLEDRRAAHRAVIVVELDRISDSCGYGVPLMRYEGERTQTVDWIEAQLRRSPAALDEYAREHNAESIDGLPGLAVRR
jgi:hypothetical protein